MKFNELVQKITESLDVSLPKNYNIYSVGSCMLAAELTTKKLLNQGISDFTICEGYVKLKGVEGKMQHTWIELKDQTKVDETIRQFFTKEDSIDYIKTKVSYITTKRYSPQEYLGLCKEFPTETEKHFTYE